MDALQELLNKTADEFTKLKLDAESKVVENMEQIKKECSTEKYEFIKNAFENARQGKGNPADIMNQFKNL